MLRLAAVPLHKPLLIRGYREQLKYALLWSLLHKLLDASFFYVFEI